MRMTLVQPPNGLFDRYELAPPLGLLSIAAAVEQDGVEVAIIDFNLRGMRNAGWFEGDFYGAATRAIADTRPDVVGFTSMVLESHIGLELARRIKQADSGVVTVLGGPHFTAIAHEVLELYPWVDYVVTGEGEAATRQLLRFLRGQATPTDLVNVARREAGGVSLRRALKPQETLAELPFPAYHLVDLSQYFAINPRRLLDYEHGRGCIFRCSFCYSPGQWGQGEQVKQVDRVVDDVARLYRLGARCLFFVQDNFLNSPAAAKMLCQALAEARTGMSWYCYATLPQTTPDVLDALAAAGCFSVFMGVDAVSASAQRAFAKHFFKGWEKLKERLQACLDRGIVPTCAFMVDVPESGHADTDAALTTALFARNLGCDLRTNTLTLYNHTASEVALRDRPKIYTEIKPRLLFDTTEVLYDNPYAREHPELFPFHNTFLPLPLYHRFATAMHIADSLFFGFQRTLLQYVLVDNGSLWELLNHLAGQVGDLTQVHPLMRTGVGQQAFVREFSRRNLSRQTRDALALETAELHLERQVPEERVPVQVNDRVLRYGAGRYEVVDLAYAPQTFQTVSALPEPDASSRPYLVVQRDGRIEHRDVNDQVARAMDRISAARSSGEPVELPPAVLDELVTAGVLEAPSGAGIGAQG